MSFYFDIIAAVLAPGALLVAALVSASARDLRRANQALRLSNRRLAILSPRKARNLGNALGRLLATPVGEVLSREPRVAERLHLLAAAAGQRSAPRALSLPGAAPSTSQPRHS